MLRKLLALAFAGAVLLGVAPSVQARPQAVHQAVIKITRATVNNVTDKVTVRVQITGLFIAGAHWELLWKKPGTAQRAKNAKEVESGRTATTKRLAIGRWVLTVRLVEPDGTPFSPTQYPDATLSARKTITIA
jgi:hypothetical protein